jgi:endonuclease/exonuclease/phosphatase (EEP) superfamily protein YafD
MSAGKGWGRLGLAGILALAFLYQLTWIVPYLPLAPVQTQAATRADDKASIRIFIANVLMTNRAADRLLGLIEHADPDVLILTEPDAWWDEQLRGLAQTFLYRTSHPLDNTYGMILYSRLPLLQSEVKFLVEPDIPSIHARLRLRSDALVELIAVHPRPPQPAVDTAERDAELVLVGRQAKALRAPTIVAGDLNDVGWSQITQLFQQVSGLLAPRRGRGLYATYHADYPILRHPLDHLFHSREFRLCRMAVLDHFGSDHFPLLVELSYEPERQSEQDPPAPTRRSTGRRKRNLNECEKSADPPRRQPHQPPRRSGAALVLTSFVGASCFRSTCSLGKACSARRAGISGVGRVMPRYTAAASTAPISGATTESQSWLSARPATKTAGPMLRAGFTEVFVTGIPTRWIRTETNDGGKAAAYIYSIEFLE